jgi:RNA polymerase sigma-B factor
VDRSRRQPYLPEDVIDPRDERRRVEQERKLFERYQARRDPLDREVLVRRFRPLAIALANRFRRTSEPMDDLVQVACLGLLNAIDRFDLNRRTAFSSFAVPTILGELRRYFRDCTWSVHMPRDLPDRALKFQRAMVDLSAVGGRTPTVHEVARALGLTDEEVVDARRALVAYEPVSLDAPTRDDDDRVITDTLGDEESGYARAEGYAFLDGVGTFLTVRQREVLRLRFREELTQQQIGERVGLSQMQISRILREAIGRLADVVVTC